MKTKNPTHLTKNYFNITRRINAAETSGLGLHQSRDNDGAGVFTTGDAEDTDFFRQD